MSTAVTPPVEPTTPGLSEPQRIINVYTAPSKTFTDIRRNASWWAPWLLMSIVGLAFVATIDKKVTWERVTENMMANMSEAQKSRLESAPPAAQEQQKRITQKSIQYTSYASPILLLLIVLIYAAVLLGVFNFGLGAEINFKQAYAVVMYGFLPRLVQSILAIIIILLMPNLDNFNLENPVPTNPAVLVSSMDHPALYRFLVSFDIISIWICVVLGIGFASISKVKRNTAIITIIVLFFVWNLLATGIKAL
jgi:hypothetical protein